MKEDIPTAPTAVSTPYVRCVRKRSGISLLCGCSSKCPTQLAFARWIPTSATAGFGKETPLLHFYNQNPVFPLKPKALTSITAEERKAVLLLRLHLEFISEILRSISSNEYEAQFSDEWPKQMTAARDAAAEGKGDPRLLSDQQEKEVRALAKQSGALEDRYCGSLYATMKDNIFRRSLAECEHLAIPVTDPVFPKIKAEYYLLGALRDLMNATNIEALDGPTGRGRVEALAEAYDHCMVDENGPLALEKTKTMIHYIATPELARQAVVARQTLNVFHETPLITATGLNYNQEMRAFTPVREAQFRYEEALKAGSNIRDAVAFSKTMQGQSEEQRRKRGFSGPSRAYQISAPINVGVSAHYEGEVKPALPWFPARLQCISCSRRTRDGDYAGGISIVDPDHIAETARSWEAT